MFFAYNLFATSVLLAASPLLLFKKRARAGVLQKLGLVPGHLRRSIQASTKQKRIWFHAVSVGEFNASLGLIELMRAKNPDAQFFVSTTTGTGQQLAKSKVGSWATVFYFPYDVFAPVQTWLELIKPSLVVIAETEIWPGFSAACKQRGIKLVCVNGRISPRSFKRYLKFRSFVSEVLSCFSGFAVQSEAERERYLALGADNASIAVCGNMKIDGIEKIPSSAIQSIGQNLNLDGAPILVAGSTHEQEEQAVLDALKKSASSFRLIIAPRHPERFDRVAQIIEANGFRSRRYTKSEAFEKVGDVYLLDTIGKLAAFYSVATVAFVGGTLVPIGGHSLVEPSAYGIPVLCGPHTEKTRDIAQAMLASGALVQVEDAASLAEAISALLNDAEACRKLGAAGEAFIKRNQGAVEKTALFLQAFLDETEAANAVLSAPMTRAGESR